MDHSSGTRRKALPISEIIVVEHNNHLPHTIKRESLKEIRARQEASGIHADGSLTLCPEARAALREMMAWLEWAESGRTLSFVQAAQRFRDVLHDKQGIEFEQYC